MSEKRQAQFEALIGRVSTHLPPEKVEQLRGIFSDAPEAQNLIGEEVMARSEASRLVNENLAEQQRLAKEREALTALSTKVSEYDAYLQQNYLPRDQYEAVVAERNQLATQFEQLSQNYPSLVEDLGLPTTTMGTQQGAQQMFNQNNQLNQPANQGSAPGVTTPAPTNPIQHVTQLAWQQDKQNLAALAMLSPAAQHDLAVRHQQLFGAPLANMTEIVNKAASSGKALEEVWAEDYKVVERQQQLQAEQLEATVQQRVSEEMARRTSTMAINGGGIPNNGVMSPFLRGNAHVPQDQLNQPGIGVGGAPSEQRIANQGTGNGTAAQAATQAYLSGKYATERFDIIKA